MATKITKDELEQITSAISLAILDVAIDRDRLRKWLSLIASVNACDYEYVEWAKAALDGKEPPYEIIKNKSQ